jgi:hypothetical protein
MNNQIHSGGSASMPDSNDVFSVAFVMKVFVSSTTLLRELRREVPENLRKSEKISLVARW